MLTKKIFSYILRKLQLKRALFKETTYGRTRLSRILFNAVKMPCLILVAIGG